LGNGNARMTLATTNLRSGRVLTLAVCGLCAAPPTQAATVAEYFFNGGATYSSATGQLSVDSSATIFASAGLPSPLSVIASGPGANVTGSQVDLVVALDPTSVVDNGAQTIANFLAITGQPVQLFLGNGTGGTATSPVLTGALSSVQLTGVDGLNAGILTAYLHPNGGSAFSFFSDPSDVIALNFDLTTTFAGSMYASSFTGQINGQIESTVPLPASGWLLGPGLAALLGISGRARRRERPLNH